MKSWASIRSIFMHADGVDWMLMGLGLIGAVADGFLTPIYLLIIGLLLNDLGGSSSDRTFMTAISKNALVLLYVAAASWVICFLGARKIEKVSKELMDQKPITFPPISSMLPTPVLPPVPLPVPISRLGEAVSATKGGVENGVGMLSKDTKLVISIPKTAATNGVGTELVLTVTSRATRVRNANDNAASGPGGPDSSATGSTYVSTSGTVIVDGPNPSAYSTSIADRQATAGAEAGSDGATSNGSTNGYAYTRAGGSIGNSIP